jgi:hypothetical protein
MEFNASSKRIINGSLLVLPLYNNIASAPGTIEDMLTDTLPSSMSRL